MEMLSTITFSVKLLDYITLCQILFVPLKMSNSSTLYIFAKFKQSLMVCYLTDLDTV